MKPLPGAGAALSVLLVSVAALMANAQDAPGPSIWSGVFSAAQAKRGSDAYQASCSSCHGSDLREAW
jgi:cytochrome c5